MYRGFIAALSGEYRASAGRGLAYRTRTHIFGMKGLKFYASHGAPHLIRTFSA
jgi:hypothetical protein